MNAQVVKNQDVRIGMVDGNYIHLQEAEINYIPDSSNPTFVEVSCEWFCIKLPYNSIEYIYPNWNHTKVNS